MSSCLSLQNSKQCPAFQQYEFDTHMRSFYNGTVKDISILDANILDFINLKSVDQLVTEYNCKREDVVHRKYLRTFTCAIIVGKSVACNIQKSNFLCKSDCDEYINSVLDILKRCSPKKSQLDSLNDYCNQDLFSNSTNCISAQMNQEDLPKAAPSGWNNGYVAVIIAGLAVIVMIAIMVTRCAKMKKAQPGVAIAAKDPKPQNPPIISQANESLASSYQTNSYAKEHVVDKRVSSQPKRRTTSTNSVESSATDRELVSILAKSEHHYKCIREYIPTLDDEVEIAVGDILAISHQYDDGWAYGANLSTGGLGVIPLSFIVPTTKRRDIATRESVYGNKKRLELIKNMRSTYSSSMASSPSSSRYSDAFSNYTSSAYTTTTNNAESIYTSTTYQPPSKKKLSEYTDGTRFTGITDDSNYTMDSGLSDVIKKDMATLRNDGKK
eukprot:NODE_114_length_19305_cov_0.149849.p3 type:complete len:441 gc:universal NODE_114_length_19305_cov_0.149849:6017-4695(-)